MDEKVILVGKYTCQAVANPGLNVSPYCTSHECGANTDATLGIKKLASLHRSKSLCPHISCIATHLTDVALVVNERQSSDDDNNDDDDIIKELVICKVDEITKKNPNW